MSDPNRRAKVEAAKKRMNLYMVLSLSTADAAMTLLQEKLPDKNFRLRKKRYSATITLRNLTKDIAVEVYGSLHAAKIDFYAEIISPFTIVRVLSKGKELIHCDDYYDVEEDHMNLLIKWKQECLRIYT